MDSNKLEDNGFTKSPFFFFFIIVISNINKLFASFYLIYYNNINN